MVQGTDVESKDVNGEEGVCLHGGFQPSQFPVPPFRTARWVRAEGSWDGPPAPRVHPPRPRPAPEWSSARPAFRRRSRLVVAGVSAEQQEPAYRDVRTPRQSPHLGREDGEGGLCRESKARREPTAGG